MSEWAADMARMRDLGFTSVRAFVAWDRIEPVEGRRDYSKLDHIFELAERNGLHVLLNVGGVFDNLVGVYPPPWLARAYPCQPPIENPDVTPAYVGIRRKICFDDPIYREKAGAFLAEVISRYAGSPALDGWVIWNEPHWRGCYCPHTLARFREWLRARYAGVRELCAAWSTEFPVVYNNWDEVEAPTNVGFLEGGYAAWLDWQSFCQESMTGAMAWVSAVVKKWDPLNRPTTTNITSGEAENDAIHRHTDLWQIGQLVDVVGYSNYTYTEPRAHVLAARLDRIRSTSRGCTPRVLDHRDRGGSDPVGTRKFAAPHDHEATHTASLAGGRARRHDDP